MSRLEPKVRWWSATSRSLSRFAPARRPHARRRLRLECLEDRTMLSTIALSVNTLLDDPNGPISGSTNLTLRDAITQADADTANPYVITFSMEGKIDLTTPLPNLANSIALQGPGSSDLTVQRDSSAPDFSVFTVDSGVIVSVSDMTISGGNAVNGGGIYNVGTLTVTDSTISNNSASSGGGLVNNYGGGVYNVGILTVSGSTFSNNSAVSGSGLYNPTGNGGGLYNGGTATVTNTTITGNSAGIVGLGSIDFGNGGGIDNTGTLTVTDSSFSGNSSTGYGGGIYSVNLLGSGPLTVTGSTFTSNHAINGGGGIYNGGTATVIDSAFPDNSAFGGDLFPFEGPAGFLLNVGIGGGIDNGGTLSVTDTSFTSNVAGFDGGGIYNAGTATVTHCIISNNSAGFYSVSYNPNNTNVTAGGGGIYNGSTVTVTDSTISNNSIGSGASPIAAINGGGGVYNAGTLIASDSTFTGNGSDNYGYDVATNGLDIFDIYGASTVTNCTIGNINGIGTVTNCTVDSIYGGGTLVVTNCTVDSIINEPVYISGNQALYSVIVNNTIVYDIEGQVQPTSAYDLVGTGGSGGLVNGTNGNQVGVVDLGLDPNGLQYNGGPTQTILLEPGSPAIDAGSNALAIDANGNLLTTDQRGPGFPRILGHSVDIGTYEFTPLSQTISFGSLTGQTYGVAPITLNATATSGLTVSYMVVSGPATISDNLLTVTGAGTVDVEASQPGNATYSAAAPVDESFTVSPAPLTITPTAGQSMTYGGTVPALTYTYTGLVNGDPSATFSGGLATTATSSSSVGGYAITVGNLVATGNYTIGTFNPGTLTVNAAPLTVTPTAGQSMVYYVGK